MAEQVDIASRIRALRLELAELQASLGAPAADAGEEPPVSEHARFLDAVLENLPNMVFVKDAKELRFVRFNRAGEQLLGWPRSALIGKNDFDFFPTAQAEFFTQKDRAVLAGREVVDIPEEPIQTAHGERWLHTRKVPVLSDSGEPLFLLGISEDITEQRRAQAELVSKSQALERSNHDLEQFAFIASHDLKEPLRKIQAFAEIIADDFGAQLDPTAMDYLDRMRGAAARLQELVDSLLAYSRVATRAKPMERVDLATVVLELLSDLGPMVADSAAVVTLGVLPVVTGDPLLLRQLLQNLIGNALKFHTPGEPPQITIQGHCAGLWCEFSVEDQGIGIPPEHRERVFGMFQRLHTRSEYPGSGIGLAICKKIVERHGGTLTVSDGAHGGTRFTVRIPAQTTA